MKRVIALLVLAPALASAEPSALAVFVGPSMRRVSDQDQAFAAGTGDSNALALDAMIGYRVRDDLAVGVRAGVSSMHYRAGVDFSMPTESLEWDVMPIDVAVAAQYTSGRFAVMPWLGQHFSRLHARDNGLSIVHDQPALIGGSQHTVWTDDFASYGITASFDAVVDPQFRMAMFAGIQTGKGAASYGGYPYGESFNYTALSLGIAYRR